MRLMLSTRREMATTYANNLITARRRFAEGWAGPTTLLLRHPHSCIAAVRSSRRRALRSEWKDYQDAVDHKDLARALRSLKSLELEKEEAPQYDAVRDWQVLDTCLNADDMKLVSAAYSYLQDRRFLPHFAKFRHIVLEGTREVTPSVVKSETGLEVTKLSPKKWGVSGASSFLLLAFLGGSSFLLSRGIDIRTNLVAILGLAFADAILLGGSCLALISSYWPPFKRRILVHEAGHLLVAYLMGCPIRGVILNPFAAMRMGTQGQAGTQFWDENMSKELAEGQLSGTTFDRYCMVLFAGIAAEALVYGEAEGGENDENLFRSICVLLNPPLSVAEMSNQARWSVLQAYNLLKWHRDAHTAAVKALESDGSLSTVIMRVEEAMLPSSSGELALELEIHG